jgi:acetyl esterase/lipase
LSDLTLHSSEANVVRKVARAEKIDLNPLRLTRGIPIHPGFVRWRSKSELEQPHSPFLTLDMVDQFLGFALLAGCTKDHPITFSMGSSAPPLEELNLPPLLLCIAENDLVIDTKMEYYEAMKKANKEVELSAVD